MFPFVWVRVFFWVRLPRAFHIRRSFFSWGLDLQKNCIANCKELGIFEPLVSKIKSLKFATEAAITILRIDDLIKLKEEKPAGEHEG